MYNHNTTDLIWSCTGSAYCNPSDLSCNDLALGSAADEGGTARWTRHSLLSRGTGESYGHYSAGHRHGIVPVGRSAMVNSVH
jgi:hypothetical protein